MDCGVGRAWQRPCDSIPLGPAADAAGGPPEAAACYAHGLAAAAGFPPGTAACVHGLAASAGGPPEAAACYVHGLAAAAAAVRQAAGILVL